MGVKSIIKKIKKPKASDIAKEVSESYNAVYQKMADAGFDDLTHMKNYYNKASAGLWNNRTDEQKHRYLLSVLSDPSVSADSQDLLNALKERIVKDYKHNKTLKNPEPIAKEDYKYSQMNKQAFDDLVTSYLASDPKFSIHPTEQWIDEDHQKIFDEYIDREWQRELDRLEQDRIAQKGQEYPVAIHGRLSNQVQRFNRPDKQQTLLKEALLDRVLHEGEIIRGDKKLYESDAQIDSSIRKNKALFSENDPKLSKEDIEEVKVSIPEGKLYKTVKEKSDDFLKLRKQYIDFLPDRYSKNLRNLPPFASGKSIAEQLQKEGKPVIITKEVPTQAYIDALNRKSYEKYREKKAKHRYDTMTFEEILEELDKE